MDNSYQKSANDINIIILEQTKLLSEASKFLNVVLTNLSGFLIELAHLGSDMSRRNAENLSAYEKTVDLTFKMTEYIDQVHIEIPALAESMNQTESQLKKYQEKLELMKDELEKSENLLSEAKEKKASMRKEAIVQANYSAAMGSILGTMLWRTSKTADVIDTFISEGIIRDFIIMADVTMKSFMDSYDDGLPSTDTYEFKFAMSILGISINVSAQKSGRDFLLGEQLGVTYVHNILDHLRAIKMSAGRLLKRMCLMFIFNLCICKRGAKLVQISENGVENILQCFGPSYTSEIHSIALNLMKALLDEIPTKEFCQQIIKMTSRDDLRNLMENGEDSVKHSLKSFHNRVVELDTSDSP